MRCNPLIPEHGMSIPVLRGIAAIVADYDAFILDLWGVVHNGIVPFSGVIDCLARLRREAKRVVILSNAPRRAYKAAVRLKEMGIAAESYGAIVTSGEAAHRALARRAEPWSAALGKRFYHLGKAADADLLDNLDYQRAATPEDAEFLLVTGTTEGENEDDTLLLRAAALGLVMVCVNPDLVVIHDGRREPCAGALAVRYGCLGGKVQWVGKPHIEVYKQCFEALDPMDHSRILVVGDGLTTDIRGAQAAELDSLLVTGGLLADAWGVDRTTPPETARLEEACRKAGITPTAAVPTFVW